MVHSIIHVFLKKSSNGFILDFFPAQYKNHYNLFKIIHIKLAWLCIENKRKLNGQNFWWPALVLEFFSKDESDWAWEQPPLNVGLKGTILRGKQWKLFNDAFKRKHNKLLLTKTYDSYLYMSHIENTISRIYMWCEMQKYVLNMIKKNMWNRVVEVYMTNCADVTKSAAEPEWGRSLGSALV